MRIGRTLTLLTAVYTTRLTRHILRQRLVPAANQLFSAKTFINGLCPAKMATLSSANGNANANTPILQQILKEFGRQDTVKVRDAAKVEKLLTEMVQGGSKSLQIITDFDHTLTRHHLNGEKCDALHGILAYSSEMPQDFRDKTRVLYNKYYPIEISHSLTEEERLPFMVEWYEKSHELIVGTGLDREFLKQLVRHSKCVLRDNAKETFKILRDHDIPILIFSAGLGDLLEISLEQNDIFYPNVKVVSNYMEFDPGTGKISGFKLPLIHTLNKNEAGLFGGDTYFMDLAHRGNALVIGDNVGDAMMSDGMKEPNALIKIGFLNDRIDERLNNFMDIWDIVLCDDQSFDFINLILKNILK